MTIEYTNHLVKKTEALLEARAPGDRDAEIAAGWAVYRLHVWLGDDDEQIPEGLAGDAVRALRHG